jgi:hypothetical protein
MSLDTAMVIEVRTAGSGSGGYKTGASGTDRSQQDAPYIGPMTDIEIKGGNQDRIYSVTEDASFVADLIGNTVRITGGTNFTVGTYEITGQGNDGDNYLDLDRNCASGNTNDGGGMIGGALPDINTLPQTLLLGGHTCYYKNDGVYDVVTLSIAGQWNNRISHIGYNSSRDDDPEGDDRPLFQSDDADYMYITGGYQDLSNMRAKATVADFALRFSGIFCRLFNAKAENTAVAGTHMALYWSGANPVIDSVEAISADRYGIYATVASFIARCYVHDCVFGIAVAAGTLIDSIVDTCSLDGIKVNGTATRIANCTIWNCGDGIESGDASLVLFNNQIINNAVGWRSGATVRSYADYNNFYDNTLDCVGGAQKGVHTTSDDPGFTNAANGDFSGVDDANGAAIELGVG